MADGWTHDETARLIDLRRQGFKYAELIEHFPGRTVEGCKRQIKSLPHMLKHSVARDFTRAYNERIKQASRPPEIDEDELYRGRRYNDPYPDRVEPVRVALG